MTVASPDAAYVVVGVEIARTVANVKPRHVAVTSSDSTLSTLAAGKAVVATHRQRPVSQITSRSRGSWTFADLSTLNALQIPWKD
jgi:hypothetical protein